jgi:hypothetical protein
MRTQVPDAGGCLRGFLMVTGAYVFIRLVALGL